MLSICFFFISSRVSKPFPVGWDMIVRIQACLLEKLCCLGSITVPAAETESGGGVVD